MENKKVLHTLLKIGILVLSSAFIGMLLMFLVYLLPTDAMAKNVLKSEAYLQKQEEWDNKHLLAGTWNQILDTGTNMIMIHEVIYPNSENAFENSMLVPSFNVWSNVDKNWTVDALMKSAEGREYTSKNTLLYPKYWHGYLTILKPLFSIMDIQGIYILNTITLSALTIAVLVLLYKRLGRYFIAYLVTVLCMHPENMVQSFQLSAVFYALNITMLILLMKKDWKKEQILYIFAFDGILIAFFDFLTYPSLAVAIPLLTVMLMEEKMEYVKGILVYIQRGIAFLIGYAGMWGMKWILATVLTSKNVIADALHSVLHRTGAIEQEADATIMSAGVPEALYRNISIFFDKGNVIVLAISILVIVVAIGICRNKLQFEQYKIVFSVITMLIPFAWIIVLNNHCSYHSHLEWRTLCTVIYALGIMCISVLNKKEDRIWIK